MAQGKYSPEWIWIVYLYDKVFLSCDAYCLYCLFVYSDIHHSLPYSEPLHIHRAARKSDRIPGR